MQTPITKIFIYSAAAAIVFGLAAACAGSKAGQASPEVRAAMRDAYKAADDLYGYVWSPKFFISPQHEKKIASLIDRLVDDFHDIDEMTEKEQLDPGFRIALVTQQNALKDIRTRFRSGGKEYANWRLRGLAHRCAACHSRSEDPSDFFGGTRITADDSFEGRLAEAEFLIASRQFEKASNDLFHLAELAGRLDATSSDAMSALKLWLVIQTRVKSRHEQASKQLDLLLQRNEGLSVFERQTIKAWRDELLLAAIRRPFDEETALENAQALLQQVEPLTSIPEQEEHLVTTLAATRELHTLMSTAALPEEERRRAMYLLAVAYSRLPIESLEVFAPMYLEQTIREFPGSRQARLSFHLYKEQLEFQSSGSGGLHLEDEDRARLEELRMLAGVAK